jgi:hypothetical protein
LQRTSPWSRDSAVRASLEADTRLRVSSPPPPYKNCFLLSSPESNLKEHGCVLGLGPSRYMMFVSALI